MNLDHSDPLTRDHMSAVLSQVRPKLFTFLQQDPHSPLSKRARRLMMMLQGLVSHQSCIQSVGAEEEPLQSPFFVRNVLPDRETRTSTTLFVFLKLVDKMCCREVEDKIFWINSIQLYLLVSFVPMSPFLYVHQCNRKQKLVSSPFIFSSTDFQNKMIMMWKEIHIIFFKTFSEALRLFLGL